MYQTKIKSTNYQEKNCFSLLGEPDAVIYRVLFCQCSSEQNFDMLQHMYMRNDHIKKVLSGKEVAVGNLIMADNYGEKGNIPEKQLLENFRRLIVKNNLTVYPSGNVIHNLKEHLVKAWDFTVPFQEPDYVSLFIAVTTCLEKTGSKTFYIDIKNMEDFQNLLDQLANADTSNPDVYITDKFIDSDKAREILKLNPKVVVLFGNAEVDPNYIHDFRKKNINIVPTSLTQMGNFIFAEGVFSKNRSTEESFQLINVGCKSLNETLWNFSLNSRENLYDIVEEIFQAHINENAQSRFRLKTYDIGAMSYRA